MLQAKPDLPYEVPASTPPRFRGDVEERPPHLGQVYRGLLSRSPLAEPLSKHHVAHVKTVHLERPLLEKIFVQETL